ncbi:hypothetical protein [Pseudodonghicola sp.]|uniref:hypothetical protein n=1 Tax=Pseudodonghicola sp. TaxID=1969463 RepID=UPI003A9813D7
MSGTVPATAPRSRCPTCHTPVPRAAGFRCPACRSALRPAGRRLRPCHGCGAPLPLAAVRNCPACGQAITVPG